MISRFDKKGVAYDLYISMKIQNLLENPAAIAVFDRFLPGMRAMAEKNPQASEIISAPFTTVFCIVPELLRKPFGKVL